MNNPNPDTLPEHDAPMIHKNTNAFTHRMLAEWTIRKRGLVRDVVRYTLFSMIEERVREVYK